MATLRAVITDGLPLLGLQPAQTERFVTPRGGRSVPPPERNRESHAEQLIAQIDAAVAEIARVRANLAEPPDGAILTAVGPHIDDPAVARQIAPPGSNTELLVSDEGRLVFRVGDDLITLRRKTEAYASQDTHTGRPRNNNLIARIDEVGLATIADLSLNEIPDDIDDAEKLWVELWTRGGTSADYEQRTAIAAAVAAFAALNYTITGDPESLGDDNGENLDIPVFRGPERDVHLVYATGEMLKSIPTLLPDVAEVHRAPSVHPIVLAEANDASGRLADVTPPFDEAPAVAIHDTGIDADHPYINPILIDAGSVVPGEPASHDAIGHGTQMAGVGAYSQLAAGVAGGNLLADAWLVSVRLFDSATEAGGDPERGPMWAERTAEAVSVAEDMAEGTTVIHNVSIGADNETVGRTDRTSWSVAADLLAWNNGDGRLLVVATGNADTIPDPADYPFINLGPPHLQQPGQAWNVLTVGGYTALDQLTAADVSIGYPAPLAASGQLSPHSRTAVVANRPIKPDIVMEAGNTAPDGSLDNPEAQGLTVLTLRSSGGGGSSLLRRTYMTSPAAAAASNALARIAGAQPTLRPATWRALLVHSATWPESATQQLPDRRDLLRAFGYGVPHPERAVTSASNRPVMVYEGSVQPSRHDGTNPSRHADFIEIPLPDDELQAIGDAVVTVRVTLSYFIQPTDNLTRRTYAGGRLRWDLQGPAETDETFRSRVNKLVREQGIPRGAGSYQWQIPETERSRGTVQHDFATVHAADVAGSRLLAVYPVLGWWEDSAETWPRELPYSVVVSVDLGDVDVDLYALTASSLVPVAPAIEIS